MTMYNNLKIVVLGFVAQLSINNNNDSNLMITIFLLKAVITSTNKCDYCLQ